MVRLETWLRQPKRWLWGLLGLIAGSVAMFAPFGVMRRLQSIDGVTLVDAKFYAPAKILEIMTNLPEASKGLYTLYLLVDVVYLLGSAVFFGALLVRIWRLAPSRWRLFVLMFPVIFAVADFTENLGLAVSLVAPNLIFAGLISVATALKFFFFVGSFALLVIGWITRIFGK